MPQRNGPKSHKGRSAIARKVLHSGTGNVNGMMPQREVFTLNAGYVSGNTYFGGNKKGGAAPIATGFMRPSGAAKRAGSSGEKPNYLFKWGHLAKPDPMPSTVVPGPAFQIDFQGI
tara:strand:- start:323 stop:670 length:348 start_codon:yes stop_codon:yes gene_type:complete